MIQTVLVADDDQTLREQVAWCLLARGYRVLTAGDGYEALDAMLSSKIDLLLLDMRMPRIDGHHVLRRMKEEPTCSRVAVVVMTGVPREFRLDVPSLLKPFEEEKLLQMVTGIIGVPFRRPAVLVPIAAKNDNDPEG